MNNNEQNFKEVEGFINSYTPNEIDTENTSNKIREDNLKKDAIIELNHKTLLDRNIQELKEKIIKDEAKLDASIKELTKINPNIVF